MRNITATVYGAFMADKSIKISNSEVRAMEEQTHLYLFDNLIAYKNRLTGEIKIEVRLEHTADAWYVIQNGTILNVFNSGLKAKRFFNENLEMDLYISQSIEDNGEYIRVFTDYGCRCFMKFEKTFPEYFGSGNYIPGIENYQLDGYPVVWVKTK